MNEHSFNLLKDSQIRRSRASSPAEQNEPTQQEIDDLFSERITPETELPPMQPLFRMFDVQATLIMEKLMALAKEKNCCIVCVLHQNKSEQDRNMRGSIGSVVAIRKGLVIPRDDG